MKSKWVWALLLGVLGVGVYVGNVLATPPIGVTTLPIAMGRFDPINTKVKTGAWKASIRT
jgi:hypothetical protein